MPEIIEARPADAGRLARLSRKTYEETFIGVSYYTRELVEGYTRAAFSISALAADLGNPNMRIFIAEVDGEAAAYAKTVAGKSTAALGELQGLYLERLYVDASFKRQGLGSKLLAAVYGEAKARGYRHVWLSVWELNPAAKAFYKALGYYELGDWEWIWESCGQRFVDRDLIYAVDL